MLQRANESEKKICAREKKKEKMTVSRAERERTGTERKQCWKKKKEQEGEGHHSMLYSWENSDGTTLKDSLLATM